MRFFFDNCLPPRFACALQAFEEGKCQIVHLRDKFSPDVEDADWIEKRGAEGGWTIVSADSRIPRNPQIRAAWRGSKLTAFFFEKGWANHAFEERAWRIMRWWPLIKKQAELVTPGQGFLVPVNFGKLKVLSDK